VLITPTDLLVDYKEDGSGEKDIVSTEIEVKIKHLDVNITLEDIENLLQYVKNTYTAIGKYIYVLNIPIIKKLLDFDLPVSLKKSVMKLAANIERIKISALNDKVSVKYTLAEFWLNSLQANFEEHKEDDVVHFLEAKAIVDSTKAEINRIVEERLECFM